MKGEFHDLAEALLNQESGGTTVWGNLGYWAEAQTYPEACTALADQLGQRLQLGPQTRLLDVGFGCGDQLLHWLQHYDLRELDGLNLSHSQTELAQQRLTQKGYTTLAARLHQGSVSGLRRWAADRARSPADTLLALDCAYHFPSRHKFLVDAAALLPAGGRLGMTDLVLGREDLTLRESLPLRAMTTLSRIPRENLVTAETYQAQWQACGLEVESFTDLTDQVFLPFGQWLQRYRATYGRSASRSQWAKYEATARFLAWAQRHGVLRYIVCTGRKTSGG